MPKVILLVCLLSLLLSACTTPTVSQKDQWFAEDKSRHFMVSMAIAGAASAREQTKSDHACQAARRGVGLVMVLGVGKEAYDHSKPNKSWSWKDMAWNLLGAVTGAYLATGCH